MLILSVNVVIINSKHVWTLESNFFQTEILELNFHVAIHVGSVSLKKKKTYGLFGWRGRESEGE